MNTQKLKEMAFPCGNLWFYIPCNIWIIASAMFFMTFPALLYSLANSYSANTGIAINMESSFIILSGDLFNLGLNITQLLIVFIVISMIFDGIELHNQSMRQRGYL